MGNVYRERGMLWKEGERTPFSFSHSLSPPSLSVTIEVPSPTPRGGSSNTERFNDIGDAGCVRYYGGEFSGGYVESITEKAGNRKKFKVGWRKCEEPDEACAHVHNNCSGAD